MSIKVGDKVRTSDGKCGVVIAMKYAPWFECNELRLKLFGVVYKFWRCPEFDAKLLTGGSNYVTNYVE